ncbi:MAG: DUF433 domain-containing protein [Kiritimatiellae bacterium]|jgi:uncharacterized protein (DUF433 family)|nr:DUF433 domain-containing protein [Kiritimatiellia bacterium]
MKTKSEVISSNPGILGGVPVFQGTRVPVSTLMDYLESGDSIDLFLYDFPTVSREQVVAVLEVAKQGLLESIPA